MRGLSIKVAQGSIHVLVGGNGCGKSTVLRLFAGLLKAQRGKVVKDSGITQALLPQDPKTLFACDSIDEELHEWQERCGYLEEDVDEILERFGLAKMRERHPYDLSGGQQQKLAIAKLLLCKPKLLLLDEPTKGLDPMSASEIARIMRELARSGITVLFVTHDLDFALLTADSVTMLFDGEAACTEPSSSFFANNLVYKPHDMASLYGVC